MKINKPKTYKKVKDLFVGQIFKVHNNEYEFITKWDNIYIYGSIDSKLVFSTNNDNFEVEVQDLVAINSLKCNDTFEFLGKYYQLCAKTLDNRCLAINLCDRIEMEFKSNCMVRKANVVEFKELYQGDVFRYENKYFLKLQHLNNMDLSDNTTGYIISNLELVVEKINCELNINE